ncbi:MAG: hypothetical protein ISQ11_00635 [Planctomycetes bacterium]|nr:hypothetical protein [Planctomycetota bacterium]
MSKKSDLVAALIKEVKLRHPMPSGPTEGLNLLEQGAVIVLMRHMTQKQAEQSVKALKGAYEDWNEVRVCQAQEISENLKHGGRKKGVALLHDRREAAMALKGYLQDVFQETDALDLEELREEPQVAGKAGMSLSVLGHAGASYLMFLASDGQVPVHLPLIKLLDRLGLIPKTTSLKKARGSVDNLVGKGQELDFTLAIHEVLELWDDEEAPIYMTVPCLQATDYGKKSFKDRSTAIAKAEAARKREEERIRKDEERERKRAEAEAKKRARELERKRAAEEKKLAAARAKAAAAEAKRKEAEAKRAEVARKMEAAKKEAAAKKLAAKKAAAKKAAAKKAAAKKAAAKKAAAKKAAAKKAAAKKKPAASKIKASKKPAASKKKASKKKPAAKKKAATKKKAAKKPAAKKKAAKKPAAKKKAATRRR